MHIKSALIEIEIVRTGLYAAISLPGRRLEGFMDRTGQGLSSWGVALPR